MENDYMISAELQAPEQLVSKRFIAAAVQRCRWLPCPSSESSSETGEATAIPAALAVWSEDVQVR